MNDPVNYVDLWGLEGCPILDRLDEEDAFTIFENAIADIRGTDFAKTDEGKLIVQILDEVHAAGKISFADLGKTTRAQVQSFWFFGKQVDMKITTNTKLVPDDSIAGRLVHEATHILNKWKYEMKGKDLNDEAWAFQNAYIVDTELGATINDNASWASLMKRYPEHEFKESLRDNMQLLINQELFDAMEERLINKYLSRYGENQELLKNN